ncbi:MAG: hypothetical protein OQK95_05165 [Gammaproteobacteria bacterium]|nr:hypothetical protein [Gammaproteobacteria bacterium]MCW9032401.1 hypothetical protein [Gammaproteobacteria bacterium]
MAKVLTTGSLMICGHGGTANLISTAKLEVSGKPVLIESDASSWPLTKTPCGQASSGGTSCTTIASITAGKSSKLTVGGVAVLLDSISGTTNGAPDNTNLSATEMQNKLESI